MNEALFYLDPESQLSLQNQIRGKLVDAIVSGSFPAGSRLPSSRKLAEQLGVARNTVVLAYEQLIEEGFIESRQRSGIFVLEQIEHLRPGSSPGSGRDTGDEASIDWEDRIRNPVSAHRGWALPSDWMGHDFPFVDGQFDDSLYPTAQWREASRMALGARIFEQGSRAAMDADDPMLLEEIRTKMLPRRGITASPDEILITLGEQNALFLLINLLADAKTRAVVEEPGNPAVRQLIAQQQSRLIAQPVDENGMVVNRGIDKADLVYVTPSHQVPTAVTMPMQRRRALLKKAAEFDQVIIEDDFEHESNYQGQAHPALRSLDRENRVVYISGVPKVLAPGLKIGFVVASRDLIEALRRLRQMVMGRPSLVNQRTAALFLSLGHYDSFMNRLKSEMQKRWFELGESLNHYMGRAVITIPNQGGTVYWVHVPDNVDLGLLVRQASGQGILIEPDSHYYSGRERSRNWIRLGVTSIPGVRIREGVRRLRDLMWDMAFPDLVRLDPSDPDLQSGQQLHKVLPGARLVYRTHFRENCTIVLNADGSMKGTAGKENEDRDTGRWWIHGDEWHRQWNQWSYGEEEVYRIVIREGEIRWYNRQGRLADLAEIVLD